VKPFSNHAFLGAAIALLMLAVSLPASAGIVVARGDIPPCVIVMPDAGTSWFVDRKENMETAVIGDLIPDVEKNWKVLTGRSGRLVAGLSMGGYGAMRFSSGDDDDFFIESEATR
jgi:enterochelin esterase-like enzyme